MATNLSLDPRLIERALEVSGERTKKAAVTRALEEFIARRGQRRLIDLMGKLEWDEGFDYKAERSRRRRFSLTRASGRSRPVTTRPPQHRRER
jgi:hypothetical protein